MEKNFLNWLEDGTNEEITINGAKVYKTTKDAVLDFFSAFGTMRDAKEDSIIKMFDKAYSEDKLLTLKALFYARDVRGGAGERRIFRICMNYLSETDSQTVINNLALISEYGRWDDLVTLIESSDSDVRQAVLKLIATQLNVDLISERPSLLAKWLPSENTSSATTKELAKKIRTGLGLDSRTYRKILSELRAEIKIVESKMSANKWGEIDYSKLPSQAGFRYRNAFMKHDEEGYRAFINSLANVETPRNINVDTLYPYQIVSKVRKLSYYGDESMKQLYDAMWKNLPDYVEGNKLNVLAVVDTSGSMEQTLKDSTATCMDVSLSLGLYLAERNEGIFHNHFITFSSIPTLQKIQGTDLSRRIGNMESANWGMSTNIEKVFDLVLNTVIKNNGTQEDMPQQIIIISDMQFDQCACTNTARSDYYGSTILSKDPHLFTVIEKRYNQAGFKLPKLVFWNASASDYQAKYPMIQNDNGLALVSGCSPSILKAVLNDKFVTPFELMLEVLESERYSQIKI